MSGDVTGNHLKWKSACNNRDVEYGHRNSYSSHLCVVKITMLPKSIQRFSMIPFSQRKSSLAVAAAIILLVGCGESHDKVATQVAAKVNKEEISVHQINFVLSRSGNIPADQVPAASKQVLDKLIDQNLLYQKAMSDKLDADPNVMQSVENTRRQIFAQAYLDKVMGAAAKATADEVHDYYTKHPELFSQRRLYRFQQVSISGGKDIVAEAQKQLAAGKSLAEITTWAQSNNLRVNNNVVVKTAEQLPLELLPKLHQMKDGQIGIIGETNGMSILQLLASQEQPVNENAATATIDQFLTNKRKADLAEAEIKRLKAEAKIEYMGDFAKKDVVPGTAAETAKAQQVAPPAMPASTQSDTVSKAISGMK
jgi:EpsD family peptidyl-prolyl cis-trans isomerase